MRERKKIENKRSGLGHSTETFGFLASPLARSYNSGHTVRAYALTQMLGFASHFVCPRPLYEMTKIM